MRSFERLLVFGRDPRRLSRYRSEMHEQLDIPVEAARSVEALVKESDLVVTTTASKQALIKPDWLHAGLHITAMGSGFSGKQELAPQVLVEADLLACDRRDQCATMGELQHAIAAGLISEDADIVELGSITSGRHPGRASPDQITLCDLTGTGVQDTAIAALAYARGREMGLGTEIEA